MLDAAERLVPERGVEEITTRDIAKAAGVPVASLYQYYADKEGLLVALAERHMREMDSQVMTDLAAAEAGGDLDIAAVVRTTMDAFVAVYHRRPSFVELYLRGRTNPAVNRFGREHNAQIARTLRSYAVASGLVVADLPEEVALVAVEVGDRLFQLAFEHDDTGDPVLIEENITLVTAYLERYAAKSGPAAG